MNLILAIFICFSMIFSGCKSPVFENWAQEPLPTLTPRIPTKPVVTSGAESLIVVFAPSRGALWYDTVAIEANADASSPGVGTAPTITLYGGTVSTAILEHLAAGVKYNVYVRSVNQAGASAWSEAATGIPIAVVQSDKD
jgi:hypothetical protein